jgi:hypothetical protein
MATVYYGAGKVRTVRNLGWLLRHAKDVLHITIYGTGDGGAAVRVTLDDGRLYVTTFGSMEICLRWFARPSMSHAGRTIFN